MSESIIGKLQVSLVLWIPALESSGATPETMFNPKRVQVTTYWLPLEEAEDVVKRFKELSSDFEFVWTATKRLF